MKLRYMCPFAKPTGYGRAAHDYLAALHQAGVELDIWPLHDADAEALEPRYQHLLPFVRRDAFDATHVLVHSIPLYVHEFVTGDLAPPPWVTKIALTTWETDKLPRLAVDRLNEHFDMVVVPSRFCWEVFANSGVDKDKLVCIGHTFDAAWWEVPEEPPPPSPFIFYSIGVWGQRKNLLGLLKAYLTEFTDDDVVLKIVAPYIVEEDVAELAARIGLSVLPRVEFVTERLDEDALWDLHASSHCFVSATRGEAWGLGAFEAAIMGRWVIMPGFGGHEDFLADYPCADAIDFLLTPAIAETVAVMQPIEIGGMRITPRAAAAPVGISGDQNWAEPALLDLRGCMRDAYARRIVKPTHLIPGADRARAKLEAHFGYPVIGRRFQREILAHSRPLPQENHVTDEGTTRPSDC